MDVAIGTFNLDKLFSRFSVHREAPPGASPLGRRPRATGCRARGPTTRATTTPRPPGSRASGSDVMKEARAA